MLWKSRAGITPEYLIVMGLGDIPLFLLLAVSLMLQLLLLLQHLQLL